MGTATLYVVERTGEAWELDIKHTSYQAAMREAARLGSSPEVESVDVDYVDTPSANFTQKERRQQGLTA